MNILEQYFRLLDEKQDVSTHEKKKADKLFRIKQKFPSWIRKILFHPFNPVYSVYLQSKIYKKKTGKKVIPSLNPYPVDFFKYYLKNGCPPDFEDYYPPQDQNRLLSFIDTRLKSMIGEAAYHCDLPVVDKSLQKEIDNLANNVKSLQDGYCYTVDAIEYFLPVNLFSEAVFIHDYGLKYLDESICGYIEDKDCLDIGAFVGDSSILFAKKYKVSTVYAYEPVTYSQSLLKKTIEGNQLQDRISIVGKGAGNTPAYLDIFINPELLSSSSTNENLLSDQREIKEKIEITTIDSQCEDKVVGLIKMDIEGSEYAALEGAKQTIMRDKPVLLISVYHTGKDFFEIPPLLRSYLSSYQFRFLDIGVTEPLVEKILVAYPQL